jgi:DNA-binding transcriptional MocR family regulator
MPTTQSLDLEEKLQLLHVCQHHNVHIVEINQYEDALPYRESQSLYALDKCEIVFHLKTFKRVYSHMINDVVIVSPKAFSNHIKFYKETYIGQVSSLNQLLINEILKEYDFALYIKQLKTKFDILRQYLSQLDFEVFYSDANNYAFIKVPFHYNLETILVELQSSNIVIQSISDYYVGEHIFKGFIISVTDVTVASLHLSLQTLIEHFSN